ncbi:MAG: transcriptional regulator, partial [Bacteroidetes bacterium]|nr:transcriptional regulator [Bacteroidota bacterium]
MRKLLPFLLMILYAASAWAQADIPVGSWRTHFSYTQVHEVALAGDRVYAASENGFFYYDKPSQEIFVLGPLQGFSDVDVSALAWQPGQNRLLIGYRSGNINLLQEGSVTNISTISNTQFSSSKTIRAVVFRGDSALL